MPTLSSFSDTMERLHLKQLELYRAHVCTLCTPCYLHVCMQHHATLDIIVDDLYLYRILRGQLCAWAEGCCILIVGTVDGCGYDGQQKYTICDDRRLCHSIRSIVRPVFCQIRQICCPFESLRCLDVKIRQFFLMTTMTEPNTLHAPLVHTHKVTNDCNNTVCHDSTCLNSIKPHCCKDTYLSTLVARELASKFLQGQLRVAITLSVVGVTIGYDHFPITIKRSRSVLR